MTKRKRMQKPGYAGTAHTTEVEPIDPRQTGLFGTEVPCDYCSSGVHVGKLLPLCPKCKRRSKVCNRHLDCDYAEQVNPFVVHCYDSECPVCLVTKGD